jgi:hypothetical protein
MSSSDRIGTIVQTLDWVSNCLRALARYMDDVWVARTRPLNLGVPVKTKSFPSRTEATTWLLLGQRYAQPAQFEPIEMLEAA